MERYDGSTGEVVAWVEVPTLDYDDDTVLYVYYGNPTVANQENVSGTWNSSYVGVWHMTEDPSSERCDNDTEICESTTGGHDGNAEGSMDGSDDVSAKIGIGTSFDGSNDVVRISSSSGSASRLGFYCGGLLRYLPGLILIRTGGHLLPGVMAVHSQYQFFHSDFSTSGVEHVYFRGGGEWGYGDYPLTAGELVLRDSRCGCLRESGNICRWSSKNLG